LVSKRVLRTSMYIIVYILLYFAGPLKSSIVHVCCLHLKREFRLRSGVAAYIIIIDQQLQLNRSCYFPFAGNASVEPSAFIRLLQH